MCFLKSPESCMGIVALQVAPSVAGLLLLISPHVASKTALLRSTYVPVRYIRAQGREDISCISIGYEWEMLFLLHFAAKTQHLLCFVSYKAALLHFAAKLIVYMNVREWCLRLAGPGVDCVFLLCFASLLSLLSCLPSLTPGVSLE
jgi:hypothetical protein